MPEIKRDVALVIYAYGLCTQGERDALKNFLDTSGNPQPDQDGKYKTWVETAISYDVTSVFVERYFPEITSSQAVDTFWSDLRVHLDNIKSEDPQAGVVKGAQYKEIRIHTAAHENGGGGP